MSLAADIETPELQFGDEVRSSHMTIASQVAMREKKREERLKKIKERQFDEQTLHLLFRLFDRNNNHCLSIRDFQTGLVAMGYREAEDMNVVGRIVSEIDTDRSGDIREDEFIAYFGRRRLEDLERRIQEVAKEDVLTEVRVIEYGVLDLEYIDSGMLHMNDKNDIKTFRSLLRTASEATEEWSAAPRRWFDMDGYHQNSMLLFSQCYGLHEETMKDAGIFQRQKMEVLTPGPGASRGNVLMTTYPVSSRQNTQVCGLEYGMNYVDSANLSGALVDTIQSSDINLQANELNVEIPSIIDDPSSAMKGVGSEGCSLIPCPNSEAASNDLSSNCPGSEPPEILLSTPEAPHRANSAPGVIEQSNYSSVEQISVPTPHLQRHASEGASLSRWEGNCQVANTTHCTIVVHALYCDLPLDKCVWKENEGTVGGRRALATAPDPSLYMSQYTIFSIDNNVVLTVRKTHSSEDRVERGHHHDATSLVGSRGGDGVGGGSGVSSNGSSSSSSSGGRSLVNMREHFHHKKVNSPVESSIWDGLRERIRCADADVRVNSSSAKYLAFSALEVIMEHNYMLRDTLRKWLHDLEDDIQNRANTTHTIHLYEFSKLASVYLSELKAVAVCLDAVCPSTGGASNILKSKPVGLVRGHSEGIGLPGSLSGAEDDGTLLDGGLSAYFDNEYIFFKDLADEVQTICMEVRNQSM